MSATPFKKALHTLSGIMLLITLVSSRCSTREIRIYDEDGRPIQGALVYSTMEFFPYFGSLMRID